MGDQSDFFVAISGATLFADRLDSAHGEHEAVIRAIADRSLPRAAEIMEEHILAIARRIALQTTVP